MCGERVQRKGVCGVRMQRKGVCGVRVLISGECKCRRKKAEDVRLTCHLDSACKCR